MPLDQQTRSRLQTVCQRRGVRRLELFGSAARGDIDDERSDLDFLVEFHDLEPGTHADAYFGLLQDLESLFERKIDLVMDRAVKNKYFREAVNRDRVVVYAA